MKNKRAYCFLLALLTTAATAMAACAEQADNSAVTTAREDITTMTNEEELDSLEARKLVQDNLPDETFDGADFTIITETEKVTDYLMEEDSGEVLDSAIFNRNVKIQERFDIKIGVVDDPHYDTVKQMIIRSVTAADDEYDLISYHVCSVGQMATGDYLYNLNDLEYLDFTRPWWSKSTVEDLSYADICLIGVGDVALTALKQTYCMYFNKVHVDSYNLESPYDIVNRGEWTIDKLEEVTKDIYQDLNTNNRRDPNDFYGFAMSNGSPVNTFLWAFDNPVYERDNDGELIYVFKTEKVGEIIKRVYNLLTANSSYCNLPTVNEPVPHDMYRKDHVIFTTGTFKTAMDWRDLEVDFGIIPYPKWDTDQEDYQTMADGNHAIVAVPYTCLETEYVSMIIEALCAESWKTVVPTYYDVALKVKGARDEESIAILDMIFENRVFDFGYVFDAFNGVSFYFQRMMQAKNTNFESYYASNYRGAIKHYEKVIEAFQEYGQ